MTEEESLLKTSDFQYYDLESDFNSSAFIAHYPSSSSSPSPYSSSVSSFVPSSTQQILETVSTLATAVLSSTTTAQSLLPTENASLYGPCDPGSPIFNCSVDMFLERVRGPQTLPIFQAITVTIVFVLIFVTGVIGNVIVCVVIVRHSTMHTATNYYLFSLAVSDLIFLLMGVPYELSLYWHQYPYVLGTVFCKMRAFLSEASTYVSVLTIVAFTMERFLAICHPLHLYTMSGFKRAVRIIAALWIVSFAFAVPFAVFTEIDYVPYPPDGKPIAKSAFCAMLENPEGFPLWEFSTCVFFVVPMAIIMVLYIRMGMRIRSRTRHTQALGVQQGSMHGDSRHTQSRKAIIRMLAAVVITFFVCWAPFHAQRLLFLYGQEWEYFKTANEWLFVCAGSLYYISCTINPILYNVMSHRYRIAFKETLCGRRRSFHSNGFSTAEQSSFRETTIAGTGNNYESSHLLRIKSVIPSMRGYSKYKRDRGRLSSSVKWRERVDSSAVMAIKEEKIPNDIEHKADVVVVLANNRNGRPKCYTTPSSAVLASAASNTTTTTTTTASSFCNNGTSTVSSTSTAAAITTSNSTIPPLCPLIVPLGAPLPPPAAVTGAAPPSTSTPTNQFRATEKDLSAVKNETSTNI